MNTNEYKKFLFDLVLKHDYEIVNNTCDKPTFKKEIQCSDLGLDQGLESIISNKYNILDYLQVDIYKEINGVKERVWLASLDCLKSKQLFKEIQAEFNSENEHFLIEIHSFDKIKTYDFKDIQTNSFDEIYKKLLISKIKAGVDDYQLIINNGKLALFTCGSDLLEHVGKLFPNEGNYYRNVANNIYFKLIQEKKHKGVQHDMA